MKRMLITARINSFRRAFRLVPLKRDGSFHSIIFFSNLIFYTQNITFCITCIYFIPIRTGAFSQSIFCEQRKGLRWMPIFYSLHILLSSEIFHIDFLSDEADFIRNREWVTSNSGLKSNPKSGKPSGNSSSRVNANFWFF
jgi:hypothetical protein